MTKDAIEIIDISPVISETTPVFPGDQKFSRQVSMNIKEGDHLELSSLTSTLHIGAHADAPIHYHKDGESIDKRSLDYYIGSCQVIDVSHKKKGRLFLEDLGACVIEAPRVLFKTDSFPHHGPWQNEFTSLSPELIDSLGDKQVKLVGIDTPSIDPFDSKELESHQTIYKHNLAILEGLDLSDVKEGIYQLVALPLKIIEADASPVRAVLLK